MSPGIYLAGAALILAALFLLLVPLLKYRGNGVATWVIVALAIAFPATVIGTYSLITTFPWAAPDTVANADLQDVPADNQAVDGMITDLVKRLETEPTVEGYVMLGRSYIALQRYPDAVDAWHRAWELSEGQAPAVSIGYAEALILADRRTLTTSAADLLDFGLQELPEDPRALWYGGLSSAARGREDEAVERFSRLLEQELPDNMRMVVQTQLAELGADIPTPAAGPPAEQGTAATGTILDVTVDIDAELASLVPPNAMLFLFARDAEQPGPPIAVKRLAAGQFPLQVRLSDSDAMVAGRKIESASRLVVVARISATGNPLESSGDLSGQAYPDPGEQLATQGIPVTITIDSATP